MKIRAALELDIPGILRIWNAVIANSSATFTSQEKSAADIEQRLAQMWVAEKTGAVLGFATYGPFRDGPGYAYVKETSIYVAQEAQGQGVARELMRVLETYAAEAGVSQLIAAIGGENASAISFHAAIGFKKVAHMPDIGRKFGRWHDLILMQKKIKTPH
jgi:phosphinothricin acetyltransferase